MTTPAQRKRAQRERDRQNGLREVSVVVPAERVREIREMADRMMREAGK